MGACDGELRYLYCGVLPSAAVILFIVFCGWLGMVAKEARKQAADAVSYVRASRARDTAIVMQDLRPRQPEDDDKTLVNV
jgi:hypothetical protein